LFDRNWLCLVKHSAGDEEKQNRSEGKEIISQTALPLPVARSRREARRAPGHRVRPLDLLCALEINRHQLSAGSQQQVARLTISPGPTSPMHLLEERCDLNAKIQDRFDRQASLPTHEPGIQTFSFNKFDGQVDISRDLES